MEEEGWRWGMGGGHCPSMLSPLSLETCRPSPLSLEERESSSAAPGQGSCWTLRLSGTESGPPLIGKGLPYSWEIEQSWEERELYGKDGEERELEGKEGEEGEEGEERELDGKEWKEGEGEERPDEAGTTERGEDMEADVGEPESEVELVAPTPHCGKGPRLAISLSARARIPRMSAEMKAFSD